MTTLAGSKNYGLADDGGMTIPAKKAIQDDRQVQKGRGAGRGPRQRWLIGSRRITEIRESDETPRMLKRNNG